VDNANVQYVGFWARVLASIVDSILTIVIITPVFIWFYGAEALMGGGAATGGLASILLQWVFPAVAVLLFWIARQATPGKMLISAKIVDANTGGKPSTGQFIGRYLGYYVSTIPLLLGLIWVGFDSRKQGWHDKLAGTLVVKSK
jgi:uncharacterized RDD family membrane protein YckC